MKQSKNNSLGKAFVDVVEAALSADYTQVRRIGNRTAREFVESGEEGLALHLRSALKKKSVPLKASGYSESLPLDSKSRGPLVEELDWPEYPLFLSTNQNNFFNNFIKDVGSVDKLFKAGLATRPRLLISGPSGTGKTFMAAHIAAQLGFTICVARLDSLISSFLGETAKNIRAIFDYIVGKNVVLLIDEIDAVAKMRDDKQEMGELKRVVNTLIQGLDLLDEYSIVIGATNNEKLLDSAIWRRFPYKIHMSLPDIEVRESLWKYYFFNDKDNVYQKSLAAISEGMSCADIMEISLAERRRGVLYEEEIDVSRVVVSVLGFKGGARDSFVSAQALSGHEKKAASIKLSKMGVSKSEIAILLDSSRTTVYKYLKE